MPPKKRTVKTPPVEEKPSWWKTLPGVITGITAFIVAVTGLITALASVQLPELFRVKGDCGRYGEGVQASSIRVGSMDAPVFEYASDESLARARILEVTDNGSKILGRVQFKFDPTGNRFEIISVVDDTCLATTEEPFFVDAGSEFPVKFKDAYVATLNLKDGVIIAAIQAVGK
ncbi:MAG: hypothetical protein ACOYYF_02950 [Chloroflexota bacterium]|nr:hypothetical protein [Chloroflexota bacterium]MBI5703632.1 hypothetical protein [Chloroflexota bacterium]